MGLLGSWETSDRARGRTRVERLLRRHPRRKDGKCAPGQAWLCGAVTRVWRTMRGAPTHISRPCPVVVVHGPETATGPVVMGLDGSAVSEQALGYAFEAAARAGGALAGRTRLG
jgi:hypothetical protein